MIARSARPVVYQSPFNKKENLNKDEKSIDTDTLSSERKFSLNKTLLSNEKSLETEFGKKEKPLDFSSKLDSVKRISEYFERDISGESVSLENVSNVDQLYRNPKDAASSSVLNERIKAFEIRIKNRVDDPSRALVKRKSANHLENVSLKKTNDSNTEFNIALSRTKRLPSIVIDEGIPKQNKFPESESMMQKVYEEKSLNKSLNESQTNEITYTTHLDRESIPGIVSGMDPKGNMRDIKDNRIIYDSISSVKLMITKYQQNIKNYSSLPPSKASRVQEKSLKIKTTNVNEVNSKNFSEESDRQQSNSVLIIQSSDSRTKSSDLKEKSKIDKNIKDETNVDLHASDTIIQHSNKKDEDEIDNSLEKNINASPDISEGSVKLIITKYQETIKSKSEKKRMNKENFTPLNRKTQNAEKSVRNTAIVKPITIEMIQVDNTTVDCDVQNFTEIKAANSSRKLNVNIPIIIDEEQKNTNINHQDSDTNSKPNSSEIEKIIPSSSIKNIAKLARRTAEIEKIEVSSQAKEPKPQPKSILNTKMKAPKNTENLSFKEELAMTLNRKYKTENDEEKPSTELTLKDFEVKDKLKQKENRNVKEEKSLVFKYQIGKKSKEEEMTDWVAVDDLIIKTKEELEIEKKQNEKKDVSNKKLRSDFEDTNLQSSEKTKDYKLSKQNKMEDRNNNEFNYQNIEEVPPDYDIDDVNDNKSNNTSQLERFIAKHVEKQDKQNKISSKGKHSSKHGATRMRSHNRPNVSEYFKENDSKIIPNGPISSAGNEQDFPVPDYD